MLSEQARLEALGETPETMREKLRRFRKLHPETYCEMFRPLLPVDALPSDPLSDQQLEVNCAAMIEGLPRIAGLDRRSAKLH
jgi:hypothetical protein